MYRITNTHGMLSSVLRDTTNIFKTSSWLTRSLATPSVGDVLFPSKSDFPSRHIGPRKTDVVSMLDTLGYKVTNNVYAK